MNDNDFYEELQDEDLTETWLMHSRKPKNPAWNPKRKTNADRLFIEKQDDRQSAIKFTYRAARFEEGWLLDSLNDFHEHGWIADVLKRIKGGKEASVYQCYGGSANDTPFSAAKVYRPRSMRNLKNDYQYREGRTDLDEDGHAVVKEGDLRAIRQRTEYGKQLLHQSWIAYEFLALERLHAAGADVPRPYAMSHNAILMDFVGDELDAAPALNEISLELAEAKRLFETAMRNIDLMLSNGIVHGDLSAYNILYWDGKIVLIDFPQYIGPDSNVNAYDIFHRDVARLCEYFARQGVRADARKLAEQLWRSHGRRLKHEVHPLHLDAENAEDRALWERQKGDSR
jgi:RIO kinase 1